ncbi:hypothetical protein KY385_03650 [Candidatus Parcubacteria bacterium]|nr:hypothetical protein [Candidatus Parcubacteria bacterium]
MAIIKNTKGGFTLIYIKKDGVFKCGYIRPILPRLKNIHVKKEHGSKSLNQGASFCVNDKNKVKSPTHYLYKHNCGQKKNGRDKCSDGSFKKINESCDGLERRSYGNFTPRGPKPHFLNVYGAKNKKALTFLRSKNLDVTGAYQRFVVKRGGIEKGKKFQAAVVRTEAVDGNIGWSYMRRKCGEWDN